MSDMHTVLCWARIALAVVEVGEEVMNDARSNHSLACIAPFEIVAVVEAGRGVTETAAMNSTHTVH